ncbi:MAG: cell division protein SepF [Provencibacterium sp.]|jgi:cell division inhibitor SepF|nr:cell division protein SepF [Provencibacterium sp.]
MNIMDRIRGFIGVEEEEDYEDELDVPGSAPQSAERPVIDATQLPIEGVGGGSSRRSNKVVNIHATTQLKVVLVKPERFDDASSIADHLNQKRTVVLNLESANREVSRRLIDFLSGVAYANNGQIKRVANSTYIITPYNVDIMGDLLDELESSGVVF